MRDLQLIITQHIVVYEQACLVNVWLVVLVNTI